MEARSNTSTVVLRVVGGDKKGSLETETVKCGRKSHRTWTGNKCAGEGQQTDTSFRQRGCYYIRTMTAGVQLRKNSDHESQGAVRQDELFGGKPPVVK
jgi:hypothetical protein